MKVPRVEIKLYGEFKRRRTFALTDTASKALKRVSDDAGCSQSEFLERLIRLADRQWDAEWLCNEFKKVN